VYGSFEQIYDDNVFAAPLSGQPQPDFISRFGPAVELGYRSTPLEFLARYGFDAERHVNLRALNNVIARQDGAIDLQRRTQRLTVNLGASYLETQSPRELENQALIVVGQARAERIMANPGMAYALSTRTKLELDHTFNRDTLEGGISSSAHVAHAGLDRRLTPRNTIRFDYRYRDVAFGNGVDERSHLASAGWALDITPFTTFEIDAGARRTLSLVQPELSTVLKHRMRQGEFSVAYARTRDTAIGEPGTLDVRRLSAAIAYSPTRYFSLTASPARVSSRRGGRWAVVHALEMEGRVRASRRWVLSASGRVGGQVGTFSGREEAIQYRGASLKTIVTLGALERDEPENGDR
jgi:hypothetical protein